MKYGDSIPQEKELEKWMNDADFIFKTLILPIAFLITITSTFLFEYFGRTLSAGDFSKLLKILTPLSAVYILIFISSIIMWSLTIFLRRRRIGIELLKLLKYVSLGLLWMSLLIVPAPLIIISLAYVMKAEIAFLVYAVVYVIILFLLMVASEPPKKTLRRCKWGIKGRYSRLCPICWFCKRKRECKSV